jgi:hypothetical protein
MKNNDTRVGRVPSSKQNEVVVCRDEDTPLLLSEAELVIIRYAGARSPGFEGRERVDSAPTLVNRHDCANALVEIVAQRLNQ